MEYEPTRPAGYTAAQILLHWVIMLLVAFQLIFGEEMGSAFRQVTRARRSTPGRPCRPTFIFGSASRSWCSRPSGW